ncbi:hypothetical protein T4A_13141 [Trichinella pseudospiralis]|uniref:Uncharacterized protein n=1 Tax=Trichinella pseudospiralis TaxID=6337 RepID=A0A0V1E3S7_TRIPS|nr:hypothetical protein T4A_13141 [Trichinella pseudospiralis]
MIICKRSKEPSVGVHCNNVPIMRKGVKKSLSQRIRIVNNSLFRDNDRHILFNGNQLSHFVSAKLSWRDFGLKFCFVNSENFGKRKREQNNENFNN